MALRRARQHVADHWAEWAAAGRARDERVKERRVQMHDRERRRLESFARMMYERLDAEMIVGHWYPDTLRGEARFRVHGDWWPQMDDDATEVKSWTTPPEVHHGYPPLPTLCDLLTSKLHANGISVVGRWDWFAPFVLAVKHDGQSAPPTPD